MTRFESYLIQLKMECRNRGYMEALAVANTIHEQYLKLRKEPDLTREELLELQREFKESRNERRKNRNRD